MAAGRYPAGGGASLLEYVFEYLYGVELAVGKVVVLLALGAVVVVLVLAYAHRLVAVVVDNLLDDHVGHGVVLARHTLDLPELVVLGLLDLAPLRVVDGQMVEPAGLLLRVGVPLLDCGGSCAWPAWRAPRDSGPAPQAPVRMPARQ